MNVGEQRAINADNGRVLTDRSPLPATAGRWFAPADNQILERRQLLHPEVATAAPGVVYLGIGGNDLLFSPIANACKEQGVDCANPGSTDLNATANPDVDVLIAPAKPGQKAVLMSLADVVADRPTIAKARIETTISEVKARFPGVPVVLVGYPMLLAPFGEWSGGGGDNWSDTPDRIMCNYFEEDAALFRKIQFDLDAEMEESARRTGVHFVSLLQVNRAHEACQNRMATGGSMVR